MTRLIVYELNEVPWRVVDHYVATKPGSNLARYLSTASKITTHTTDQGELHPWSTWPTMHRGVNNSVHGIHYINQDLSDCSSYPPIWDVLSRSGKTVGVCGSLQSFPPRTNENTLFHVPDTFAPREDTYPEKYRPFQAFNLKLASENKATSGRIGLDSVFKSTVLVASGVRPITYARLAWQVAKEVTNALNKSLRPMMQAHVAFDVFWNAMKRRKPDYVAFFTNHVAGIMHRYWKYTFPEDFEYHLNKSAFDQFHANSISKAMDIFDSQLGRLMRFARLNDYDLIVVSSMGQEAINRGDYVPELKLSSIEKLAHAIGYEGSVRLNPAMQPDVAFVFDDRESLIDFKRKVASIVDANGEPALRQRYEDKGCTLNLSVSRSADAAEHGRLYLHHSEVRLGDVGFEVIKRDQGTGYHQPNGIWLWSGGMQPKIFDRRIVDSRQYAPTLLKSMDVSIPDYMLAPV